MQYTFLYPNSLFYPSKSTIIRLLTKSTISKIELGDHL